MKNNTLNKSQKVVFAYLIFIFMNCCMLISCDKSRDKESNIAKFQQKVEIKPSVTYIDNASKQLDLVLMDKYYVVQNDVEAHQKQLSVYDKIIFRIYLHNCFPCKHIQHYGSYQISIIKF
jgi:hypothetical protein